MKLLVVHDCGFVFRDLIPCLQELGIEVEYLPLNSLSKMILEIRKSKADLVHANYIRSPAYACLLSGKRPYVLEAHGDDIRWGISLPKRLAVRKSNAILYSTEDLEGIIEGSVLLPRPVDFERFYPRKESIEKRALYFIQTTSDPRLRKREQTYINDIRSYCRTHEYELTIVDSMTSINYEDMPNFLGQFALLFDKEQPHNAVSKTALEAMAMRIKVFPEKIPLDSQEQYAKEHDKKSVAMMLSEFYHFILEK